MVAAANSPSHIQLQRQPDLPWDFKRRANESGHQERQEIELATHFFSAETPMEAGLGHGRLLWVIFFLLLWA